MAALPGAACILSSSLSQVLIQGRRLCDRQTTACSLGTRLGARSARCFGGKASRQSCATGRRRRSGPWCPGGGAGSRARGWWRPWCAAPASASRCPPPCGRPWRRRWCSSSLSASHPAACVKYAQVNYHSMTGKLQEAQAMVALLSAAMCASVGALLKLQLVRRLTSKVSQLLVRGETSVIIAVQGQCSRHGHWRQVRCAVGGAHGEQSGSGKMTGMVNQKVDPKAALEDAPIWPPSTATCLLQMLRPRPVPPALLGRFMSSSVPCTTPHRLIASSRCMRPARMHPVRKPGAAPQDMQILTRQEVPAIPSPACFLHTGQSSRMDKLVLVWIHHRAQVTAETRSYLDKVIEEGVQPLLGNAAPCVCHLKHQPLAWRRGPCLLWRAPLRVWPADERQHLSQRAILSIWRPGRPQKRGVSHRSEQCKALLVWQSNVCKDDMQGSRLSKASGLTAALSGTGAAPGRDHAIPAFQAAFLLRLRKGHLLSLRQRFLRCCPTLLRALLYSMTLSVTGSSVLETRQRLQPECSRCPRAVQDCRGLCLHRPELFASQSPLECQQVKADSRAQALQNICLSRRHAKSISL